MNENIFKWDKRKFLNAILGTLIFCFSINIFILPAGLYNGGILGISQLIRTFTIKILHINSTFDFAGIINFIINIPLFVLAYKKLSKTFFYRTLFCVGLQTIFYSIIPTPTEPIIDELITSVLIGGVIAGIGCGMVLKGSASGGGTDIIGLVLSKKYKDISVGKITIIINTIVYSLTGLFFGLEIMIYSILYSVFSSLMVDKTHDQNICSSAMIFSKKNPKVILNFIENTLERGATYWEAKGGYDNTITYIIYVSLSKYELQRLDRYLKKLDDESFMVKTEGLNITGNFQKNL